VSCSRPRPTTSTVLLHSPPEAATTAVTNPTVRLGSCSSRWTHNLTAGSIGSTTVSCRRLTGSPPPPADRPTDRRTNTHHPSTSIATDSLMSLQIVCAARSTVAQRPTTKVTQRRNPPTRSINPIYRIYIYIYIWMVVKCRL